MNIIILQHIKIEDPGYIKDLMLDDGLNLTTIELDEGEKIPNDLTKFDGMFCMGGPMDTYMEKEYPWLVEEKKRIKEFVINLKKPYLGFCLGCQLLGEVVGGKVVKSNPAEIGIMDINFTDNKKEDNLFSKFPDTIKSLQWHSYKVQDKPSGIAEAFILGEDFIGNDDVALILGDNIFFGHNFSDLLINAKDNNIGATIFSYNVRDPERFGIVELDDNGSPISIEEKPDAPKSSLAVTGLYFYNNDVIEIAKKISPSERNELEISSINQIYLQKKRINCVELGRGFAWLDAGTHSSLLNASQFVETIEHRQGYKIACLEEISLNNGWIDKNQIKQIISDMGNGSYSTYLMRLVNES